MSEEEFADLLESCIQEQRGDFQKEIDELKDENLKLADYGTKKMKECEKLEAEKVGLIASLVGTNEENERLKDESAELRAKALSHLQGMVNVLKELPESGVPWCLELMDIAIKDLTQPLE